MRSDLPPELIKKARDIKLFVLDVDGVMTDGKIIVNDEGAESKNFYVRDGMALSLARVQGFKLAVISGRYSKVVEHRATELGFHEIHQEVGDKLTIFNHILEKLGLTANEAAFMGDDINDIPVLEVVGISGAPADADDSVLKMANFVSRFRGGDGAVREMIEFVMDTQGKWGL